MMMICSKEFQVTEKTTVEAGVSANSANAARQANEFKQDLTYTLQEFMPDRFGRLQGGLRR